MLPLSKTIGQHFIELQTVNSTNNYATALLHEGLAQHGTVVFAHRQTAGRGQRSREWITGSGQNIAMTIVVQPDGFALSHLFLLSMAAAVGAHRFFNAYAGNQTKVKWPNDLYWCDRKAGGILIENSLAGGEWKHAVVGIGININQTHFEGLTGKAVSLKQITGKDYDVLALAKELCHNFEWAYNSLLSNANLVTDAYQQQLYKRNEVVRLKKGARVFDARINGVTTNGQLMTQHAIEELFDVGEVEWLL